MTAHEQVHDTLNRIGGWTRTDHIQTKLAELHGIVMTEGELTGICLELCASKRAGQVTYFCTETPPPATPIIAAPTTVEPIPVRPVRAVVVPIRGGKRRRAGAQ